MLFYFSLMPLIIVLIVLACLVDSMRDNAKILNNNPELLAIKATIDYWKDTLRNLKRCKSFNTFKGGWALQFKTITILVPLISNVSAICIFYAGCRGCIIGHRTPCHNSFVFFRAFNIKTRSEAIKSAKQIIKFYQQGLQEAKNNLIQC